MATLANVESCLADTVKLLEELLYPSGGLPCSLTPYEAVALTALIDKQRKALVVVHGFLAAQASLEVRM